MKFILEKALKFGWKGLEGLAYNSKEDFTNASCVYFEVTGSHGKVKNTATNRLLKLFLIHAPAFDPKYDIKLK